MQCALKAHQLVVRFVDTSDIRIVTALIAMYGKCGQPQRARELFNSNASRRTIEMYSALIAAYAHAADGESAARVLDLLEVDKSVRADVMTIMALLKAAKGSYLLVLSLLCCIYILFGIFLCLLYSESGMILLGERAQVLMRKIGVSGDRGIITALIDMYGKCGHPKKARAVFDAAPLHTIEMYSALIAAYAHAADGESAARVLNLLESDAAVKPDIVTVLVVLKAAAGTICV